MTARDREHDKWIPWYVDDTEGWLELSLAARGAAEGIARKMNANGEIFLRRGISGLAVKLGRPWEECEPAVAELIAKGRVRWDGSRFILSDPEYAERQRRGSAERMAKFRARRKGDAGDVTSVTPVTCVTVTPVLVSSSLVSSGSDLPEGESAREGTEKPSTLRYREAYCAGVERAKGSPFAWPPGPSSEWADKDLGLAIATFAKSKSTGKPLRGEMLTGWIGGAAEDFVRHVLTSKDEPKFWSHFAPKGLVRFLNQEVQSEEARRVG